MGHGTDTQIVVIGGGQAGLAAGYHLRRLGLDFDAQRRPGGAWPHAWDSLRLFSPEAYSLILMGHGGGQHKKAPGIEVRARRFVAECGFAVAAIDVPSHGDRPEDQEYEWIAHARPAPRSARRLLPGSPKTLDLDTSVKASARGQWMFSLISLDLRAESRAPSLV